MTPRLYTSYSAEPTQRLFCAVVQRSRHPLFRPTPAHLALRNISPHIYIGREFRARKIAVEVEISVLLGDVVETFTVTEYHVYPPGLSPAHCVCSTHIHGQNRPNRIPGASKRYMTIQGIPYLCGTATHPPRRVLVSAASRERAIHQAHRECGHRGRDPTYWRVSQKYHWESMYNDIADYVHGCTLCRACADLSPTDENNMDWRLFLVEVHDMTTSSRGHNYLFEAYDPVLGVHAALASHTNTPDALACFLEHQVIRRYGTTCAFTGPCRDLIKKTINILRNRYGRAVRVDSSYMRIPNTVIIDSLSVCASRQPDIWPLFVPAVVLALSCTASRLWGLSPDSSLYGNQDELTFYRDDPCWQIVPWRHCVSDTSALIACKAEHIVRVISAPQISRHTRALYPINLHQAHHDNILGNFHHFVIGTWVLKRERARRHVDHDMYSGPFIVRETMPDNYLRLSECDGTIIDTPVCAQRLTAYIGDMPNELYVTLFDGGGISFDATYEQFSDCYSAYLESLPTEQQSMVARILDPYLVYIPAPTTTSSQ